MTQLFCLIFRIHIYSSYFTFFATLAPRFKDVCWLISFSDFINCGSNLFWCLFLDRKSSFCFHFLFNDSYKLLLHLSAYVSTLYEEFFWRKKITFGKKNPIIYEGNTNNNKSNQGKIRKIRVNSWLKIKFRAKKEVTGKK